MVKRTFSISDRQDKALTRQAEKLGITTAEVLRRVLDAFVEQQHANDRKGT